MFKNKSVEIGPFLQNVPIGWYQTKFFALSENGDDEETSRLVMVFENEKENYIQFLDHLSKVDLTDYEETTIESKLNDLDKWSQKYFNPDNSLTDDLRNNLFYITSHMSQQKEKPKFFPFEERKYHDMDEIARQNMNLKLFEVDPKLKTEFENKYRYWSVIYPNFESFRQQFFACVQRLQDLKFDDIDVISNSKKGYEDLEQSIKDNIKMKYPNCLCCGENNKILLEIDHINPRYFGGKILQKIFKHYADIVILLKCSRSGFQITCFSFKNSSENF